jgi:Kef-type K+ transport system membrane component KefB
MAVLFILVSLIGGDRAVTNGLMVGSTVGIVFFLIAWWVVNVIIREKKKKSSDPIMTLVVIMVFILKFPLLGIVLWYAFKYMQINTFALIGGIGITQVAILISALSKLSISGKTKNER